MRGPSTVRTPPPSHVAPRRSRGPNCSRQVVDWLASCSTSASSTATSSPSRSRTRSSGSSPTSPAGTSAPSPSPCRPGCRPASSRRSSNSPTRNVVVGAPDSAMSMLPDTIHHLAIGHRSSTDFSDDPLPDATSPAWKAPTSGGSTGRPKLIVSGDPAIYDTEAPLPLGLAADGCLVMPGPLYHNGPAVWACQALLVGQPRRAAPEVRGRADARRDRDPRCRCHLHGADDDEANPAPRRRCPARLRHVVAARALAPRRAVPAVAEGGVHRLARCGSDLRAVRRDRGASGHDHHRHRVACAPRLGRTGHEWRDEDLRRRRATSSRRGRRARCGCARPAAPRPTSTSAPRQRPSTAAGSRWATSGWFDADGYLYLGDRVADMILSGGANIYPAEVEAALNEHPAVHSCAVIGLPDDDRGNDVHAIVEADAAEGSRRRTAGLPGRTVGGLQAPPNDRIRDRAAPRRRRQGAAIRAQSRAAPGVDRRRR